MSLIKSALFDIQKVIEQEIYVVNKQVEEFLKILTNSEDHLEQEEFFRPHDLFMKKDERVSVSYPCYVFSILHPDKIILEKDEQGKQFPKLIREKFLGTSLLEVDFIIKNHEKSAKKYKPEKWVKGSITSMEYFRGPYEFEIKKELKHLLSDCIPTNVNNSLMKIVKNAFEGLKQ